MLSRIVLSSGQRAVTRGSSGGVSSGSRLVTTSAKPRTAIRGAEADGAAEPLPKKRSEFVKKAGSGGGSGATSITGRPRDTSGTTTTTTATKPTTSTTAAAAPKQTATKAPPAAPSGGGGGGGGKGPKKELFETPKAPEEGGGSSVMILGGVAAVLVGGVAAYKMLGGDGDSSMKEPEQSPGRTRAATPPVSDDDSAAAGQSDVESTSETEEFNEITEPAAPPALDSDGVSVDEALGVTLSVIEEDGLKVGGSPISAHRSGAGGVCVDSDDGFDGCLDDGPQGASAPENTGSTGESGEGEGEGVGASDGDNGGGSAPQPQAEQEDESVAAPAPATAADEDEGAIVIEGMYSEDQVEALLNNQAEKLARQFAVELQEALIEQSKAVQRDTLNSLERFDALGDKLAAIEAAAADEKAHRARIVKAMQLTKAAIGLGDILSTTEPFEDELAEIAVASNDDDFVTAVLATIPPSVAAGGVVSHKSLEDRFDVVKKRARKVAAADTDGGMWAIIGSSLTSLITVPKKGRAHGDDPEAILARAEYNLHAGNLDAAVAELESLNKDGWVWNICRDWVGEAKKRLVVKQAVDSLTGYIAIVTDPKNL